MAFIRLRLRYIFRLRSCSSIGACVIASTSVGVKIPCTAGPPLHGHYPVSSLLRTPPTPSRLPHGFPGDAGYADGAAPRVSPWGEEGISSCSASPCHRAVAATPPECANASASLRRPMLPSPPKQGLGLRIDLFRGYLCVTSLRPGDSLTILAMALSIGFRSFGFLLPAIQATGASGSCPGGTDSH